MATRRIPLALTIVLKSIRFLIHLAVCAGIVFVMVKTFRYMNGLDIKDPIRDIKEARAFWGLRFELVALACFLVYTAMWTHKAIRGRSSTYEL